MSTILPKVPKGWQCTTFINQGAQIAMRCCMSAIVGAFLGLAYLPMASPAVAASSAVEDAINLIVLACVAGGEKYELDFSGNVEGGFALKRLGATAQGEVKIKKSDARGLVDGLTAAMNRITAEQASEARNCMRPYIDQILRKILGEAGYPFGKQFKIEYLTAEVEDFTVTNNGDAEVTVSLRNTDPGKGLAVALKAQYSDGIADFWKFFPQSESIVTDDRNNRYRALTASGIGFARDRDDWAILRAGQATTIHLSYSNESGGPPGRLFSITIPIRLAWYVSGQQQVSSFQMLFKNVDRR